MALTSCFAISEWTTYDGIFRPRQNDEKSHWAQSKGSTLLSNMKSISVRTLLISAMMSLILPLQQIVDYQTLIGIALLKAIRWATLFMLVSPFEASVLLVPPLTIVTASIVSMRNSTRHLHLRDCHQGYYCTSMAISILCGTPHCILRSPSYDLLCSKCLKEKLSLVGICIVPVGILVVRYVYPGFHQVYCLDIIPDLKDCYVQAPRRDID